MADSEFVIRLMTRSELDIAIDWAAEEGWNPGWFDADCFFAADPQGFFIGLVNNQPVAMISVVKYDASSGFVGFYMVKPELRGRGYGLRLWNAALNGSGGLCLGLDGVVSQQGNYRKSGFNLAWRNIRCQGKGGGPLPENLRMVPLSTIPLAEICAYDRFFSGRPPGVSRKLVRAAPKHGAWGSGAGRPAVGLWGAAGLSLRLQTRAAVCRYARVGGRAFSGLESPCSRGGFSFS